MPRLSHSTQLVSHASASGDCNGFDQQVWGYDYKAGTIYLVKSVMEASLCMDGYAPPKVGNKVQVWSCNDADQQQFNVLWGTTVRSNQDYKLCLDLEGGKASQGTLVQLWDCNGLDNQQWVYDPPSGAIIYGNGAKVGSQLCLDAGHMQQGTTLMVWGCNNQKQQVWGYDAKMMTLYLRESLTNAAFCMDIYGGTLTKGTRVDVWGCSGCWNQQFTVGGGITALATLGATPSEGGSLRSNRAQTCPPIPGPGPAPGPAGTCLGGWPEFANAASLAADPWGAYMKAVYGAVPSDGYPMCMGDFWMFHTGHPTFAKVKKPASDGSCPSKDEDGRFYTKNNAISPPQVAWSWHRPPYKAFADNTWVEVIHRKVTSDEHEGGACCPCVLILESSYCV